MSTPSAVSIKTDADSRFLKLLLLVSLPLYLLDQLTKYLVSSHIPLNESVPVIPNWFNLGHTWNTGAAWGMFRDNNLAFVLLSAAALVIVAVLYRQGAFTQWLTRAGFSLLTAGILGNLTDRLLRQHVVDFLDFDLHFPGASHFPSFNVADSCICVAVGCFLVSSWQDMRAPTVDKRD